MRRLLVALLLVACNQRRQIAPPDARMGPVAESKRAIVRRTPRPPRLDGALDDDAWKRTPVVEGFVDLASGRPSDLRTTARLLWDARHLYVAVEAFGPDRDALALLVHGAAIGTGGIDVDLTTAGVVSATHQPDTGERAPLHVRAAVGGAPPRWTAEVAIPMSDLALLACARAKVPPTPGDVWGLNVVRKSAAAWSRRVAGDLHRLDQFGEIVFVDEDGEDPASDEGREDRERR